MFCKNIACLVFIILCPLLFDGIVGISGQTINCPPLNATQGISLSCKLPGNVTTDCYKPLPSGATVNYRCGEFYRPLLIRTIPRQLRCKTNGTWSNFRRFKEYICEVECGKPTRPHNPFIAYGQNTLRYSWPWHAAIFISTPEVSTPHYICGGSLISHTMVLTAAHCIVEDLPLSKYSIVFGSVSSNWTDNLSDEYVQRMKVIRAKIPQEYEPMTCGSDIALLELESPVILSKTVSPVCFPYEDDFARPEHPEDIGEGEVIGYGTDESKRDKYQLHLKYTKLPVVRAAKCYAILDKRPGKEQFCAGIVDGSSVCKGDSGGGMVFKGHGVSRYYVQGIVSNNLLNEKSTCDGLSYFTNVRYFAPWVAKNLDHMDASSEEDEDTEILNEEIGNTTTTRATTTTKMTTEVSIPLPTTSIPVIPTSTVKTPELTTPKSNTGKNSTGNILDVCERGCSHLMEAENQKKFYYSLKGRENALEYFENLGLNGAPCELSCFELDYVEVIAAQLIASLEECKKLESICLTNIKLVGKFEQKIELTALKEFKLTSVVPETLEPDSIHSRIFFYKVDPWTLSEVTHLKTNIDIGAKNYVGQSQGLSIHWQKKQIGLQFQGCNDILEMRPSDFVLEDIDLANCEFRASVIPSTIAVLVLNNNFRIYQGSLATVVRRQANLTKIFAATEEKYALDMSELPIEVKKIYYVGGVELKSGLKSGTPEPRINLEEMTVNVFSDKILLANFSYIFPNLKQLGMIGRNDLLFEQALLRPPSSLRRIGAQDYFVNFNSPFFNQILAQTVPRLSFEFNFIVERNSKSSKWRARASTREEVSALFWESF